MSEPFKIQGADGETILIERGEFYFNVKARCHRMMLNSLSNEARRVYACLELATMGFQKELAVVMERGKERPLSPTDIGRQTGMPKQQVRRAVEELEMLGLAERRTDTGSKLRRGHVLLYSWAVPRTPKKKESSQRATTFPDWFPPSWDPLKPLAKRLRLSFPTDVVIPPDYIEETARVARAYQEAEKVAVEALERVCARPPSYKEERTERTTEITSSSVPSLARAQAPDARHPISEALAQYGSVDDDVLNRLVDGCRAQAGDCTAEEVVHFVHEKGKLVGRETRNPIGFLITAVPKCFAGDSFRQFREQQQRERERAAHLAAEEHDRSEQWRKQQLAALHNPNLADDEKQLISKLLGIDSTQKGSTSEP